MWIRFCFALIAALTSGVASAWGEQGHRISGYLANTLLRPDTRAALLALVGTDDLSQIAGWMDDEREQLEQRFPSSSRWHYENRSVCGSAIDCRRGACVTTQVDRHLKVLKSRNATASQRSEAVRILVHLLGDLHQPLHLADNGDRGGNDVLARLPDEPLPRKLHEVWDTTVVRAAVGRRNPGSYARDLARRFAPQRTEWEAGGIESWASETYEVGRTAYRSLPAFACGRRGSRTVSLDEAYLSRARAAAEEQLAKAGVRIAFVLNDALGATGRTP